MMILDINTNGRLLNFLWEEKTQLDYPLLHVAFFLPDPSQPINWILTFILRHSGCLREGNAKTWSESAPGFPFSLNWYSNLTDPVSTLSCKILWHQVSENVLETYCTLIYTLVDTIIFNTYAFDASWRNSSSVFL